jgi:hypothetical protein
MLTETRGKRVVVRV